MSPTVDMRWKPTSFICRTCGDPIRQSCVSEVAVYLNSRTAQQLLGLMCMMTCTMHKWMAYSRSHQPRYHCNKLTDITGRSP